MHLIAETELSTGARPAIMNEYVWLNGHPIAQVDSTGVTNWTFTDHLGTPILQSSSAQGVTWRAEYEPFGEVYTLRSYDRHQPLRLPGQEAEQLGTGANGVTERSYNIFRWYNGGWGRYTQADPIRTNSFFLPRIGDSPLQVRQKHRRANRMSKAVDFDALPLYSYGSENPVLQGDRLGLFRDCAEEHIGCFRRCWNSWPPWPIQRRNKGHYLYCQSKCLAEYMECEDENEAERVMTYCI